MPVLPILPPWDQIVKFITSPTTSKAMIGGGMERGTRQEKKTLYLNCNSHTKRKNDGVKGVLE